MNDYKCAECDRCFTFCSGEDGYRLKRRWESMTVNDVQDVIDVSLSAQEKMAIG